MSRERDERIKQLLLEKLEAEKKEREEAKREEEMFWSWARWQPHIQPITRWNMWR